jgi:glutathione S-transferase
MTDTKFPPENNLPAGYVPPKVWTWEPGNGGAFASINRPIAGPTQEKVLPVGKHPLQLYSMGTPNGVKVTIMLEELLAAGHSDADYDAWLIRIGDGDQFGSGFVEVNPNSKIPALMDHAPKDGGKPLRIFESGSILVYLADKFGAFLPTETRGRTLGALPRRRLRPFLRLCADEDRICHQPLRHGGEAPDGRAEPAPGGERIHGRHRIYRRRHGDLALVWAAGREGRL